MKLSGLISQVFFVGVCLLGSIQVDAHHTPKCVVDGFVELLPLCVYCYICDFARKLTMYMYLIL